MSRRLTPRDDGSDDGRRRTGWREFRDAYPRIVAGMALFMGALLLADVALGYNLLRYRKETAAMRASMSQSERQRLDTLLEAKENRVQLMMELSKAQAQGEKTLSLAVSREEGVMYLQREGARLRPMKVRIGQDAAVGTGPGSVRVAAPLGKRTLVGVLTGDYDYELPQYAWTATGAAAPGQRRVAKALGPVALVLSGGAVIYSDPAVPPLNAPDFVLPGSVRASSADIDAILENLKPGMPVYLY